MKTKSIYRYLKVDKKKKTTFPTIQTLTSNNFNLKEAKSAKSQALVPSNRYSKIKQA